MGKCLEIFKLLKLKQEERKNLNTPISRKEIDSVIKNLPTNKSPGLAVVRGILQNIKEELTLILLNLFQKIEMEGKLPNSFHKANITLMPKPKTPPK